MKNRILSSVVLAGALSLGITAANAIQTFVDYDPVNVLLNGQNQTYSLGNFNIVEGDGDAGDIPGYNFSTMAVSDAKAEFYFIDEPKNGDVGQEKFTITVEGYEFSTWVGQLGGGSLGGGPALLSINVQGNFLTLLSQDGVLAYTVKLGTDQVPFVPGDGGDLRLVWAKLTANAESLPSVPDGGASVALLGIGMIGLGMLGRKLR